MRKDIVDRLLPLAPSKHAENRPPVDLHPRLRQVSAYANKEHPNVQVGQVWENLDASKGDEYGRQQALVKSVDGTQVKLMTVMISPFASRTGLGEEFVVDILTMRHSDDQVGWVQKSVVLPVNARGEARPDAVFPKRVRLKKKDIKVKSSLKAPKKKRNEPDATRHGDSSKSLVVRNGVLEGEESEAKHVLHSGPKQFSGRVLQWSKDKDSLKT